jgi:hypothetical protein
MTADEREVMDLAGGARTPHGADEPLREAITMALYVAICLLAALTAVTDTGGSHPRALGLIWGTTVGLALAHWFAFRLSANLTTRGHRTEHDVAVAAAQLAGAAVVAAMASVPILLFPASSELDVVRLELATILGLTGYLIARRNGAGALRSIVFGAGILVAGLAIAVVKNHLAGH